MPNDRMLYKQSFFSRFTTRASVVLALAGAAMGFYAPRATAQTPASKPMLVGYLGDYKGVTWTNYAHTANFNKMTHLNLAFGDPPKCNGTCTASSDMTFSFHQQSNADVDAIVSAAHAAGVKVLVSIGGGGGDQQIIQFYNVGLSKPLVDSLDRFVNAHHIDGVDVDIEDPSAMGAPFATFVNTLVAKMRPEGKLITAAVAQYLQSSMPSAALHQFDFINVMVYSSMAAANTALNYYANECHVPKDKIVLGVPFFAQADNDGKEEDYKTVLAAYPNAWQVDIVGGGPLDNGLPLHYTGEETMRQETLLGKQYGGIMIWELMSDAPAPHSLLTIIQNNL